MDKIIAFFMAIISFFMNLFGITPVKYDKYTNLSYGSDKNQVLDLYLPKEDKDDVALMLYIHGGSWTGGDKSSYNDFCKNTTGTYGYASATMNYRLLTSNGNVTYKDMLDDIDSAINYIVDTAAEKGTEITQIGVAGASAGGHLALLYSYTRYNQSRLPIKFCVSKVGPTNFTDPAFFAENMDNSFDRYALISALIGKTVTADNFNSMKASLSAASPVYYVTSDVPPTLMAYGQKDTLVPFSNGTELHMALKKAGVPCDFYDFPNSGHDLMDDSSVSDAYIGAIVDYAKTYFGY